MFDWGDFYTLWAMAYETGYREGYFDNENENGYSPSYHNPPKFLEKMFIDYKGNDEGTE